MSHYGLKVVWAITFVPFLFILIYHFHCLLAIAQGAWAQLCMLGPCTSKHKIMHCLDVLPQFSGMRLSLCYIHSIHNRF